MINLRNFILSKGHIIYIDTQCSLLRLKEDGLNWKRSEERKDEDMRRRMNKQAEERKIKAGDRKEEDTNTSRQTIQLKISESLKRLPEVKKKAIEAEEERERRLMLKEAKEELWKRWRQRKGRKTDHPEVKDKEMERMEYKLARIEKEIAHWEKEKEKKREDEEQKMERLGRKRRKEQVFP